MIQILVVLIIAGALLWLVNYLIPMDPKFKTVVNVVAAILLLLWLLQVFGLWSGPPATRMGTIPWSMSMT